MRIACIAPFGLRARGTTAARVLPLAVELARRGHEVAVFIPPYDSPEDSGRSWRAGGLEVVNVSLPGPLAVRSPQFGPLSHLRLGWRLLRAVLDWRPDVAHVFKPKGPSGLVGLALWQRARRGSAGPRQVVDADDWEGDGGWNDDPRAGYPRSWRRFFAWQERYGLSHADSWTVTGECLRRRALAFGAAEGRIYRLPNGVQPGPGPLSGFTVGQGSGLAGRAYEPFPATVSARRSVSPRALDASTRTLDSGSLPREPHTAVLYTRFAGVRAAEVARIWQGVRARVADACLRVVGAGLAGEEEDLRGLPGIEVRGWVEPGDLPALFASTALAVIPWPDVATNRARSSVKVLELMAAGLPLVAYAVGELPATLGETGTLVAPGDAEVFAGAVAALMNDPALAARLGQRARQKVLAEFTWERLAPIALQAYACALGESP